MLKLAGKLNAVGYLLPQPPQQPGEEPPTGAVVTLVDGRSLTIIGLNKEECRKLAGDFGEPITLKLEGLPC
jgi:hypothetical protein